MEIRDMSQQVLTAFNKNTEVMTEFKGEIKTLSERLYQTLTSK